jgi:hypothetical protein
MKTKRLFLASMVLMAAAMACRMNLGGPTPSGLPIPVSTDAASSLQQQFQQAIQGAGEGGLLTLTINETQLTSLLATKLSSLPDPFISEPQVYLRDGQIQIYGKAARSYFEANVGIILTATIDSNGQPLVEISSADFGPIPVPEDMTSAISAMVQEAYTGALGPLATGFKLDSIVIADGLMMLTGRMQ